MVSLRTIHRVWIPGVFISEWIVPLLSSTLNTARFWEYGRHGIDRTTDPDAARAVIGDDLMRFADDADGARTLTIDVGTTVRWENEGALPHTVTATNAAYDSGIMAPGAGGFVKIYGNEGG